jgi:molecular chaperone GrpE
MGERQEKGSIRADIPDAAVEEALRSIDRLTKSEASEAEVRPKNGANEGEERPAGEPSPAAESVPAVDVTAVRAELELSQEKSREALAKLLDEHERYLRTAADFENYKKRAAREREDIQKFGIEKLVKDLLPAMDGLDRALKAAKEGDALTEGVKLVRSALEQALARHGVTAFSALSEEFDPERHEALLEIPTPDQPAGTVVLEHARGWRLHERLLRPAMVGVAAAPAAQTSGSGEE